MTNKTSKTPTKRPTGTRHSTAVRRKPAARHGKQIWHRQMMGYVRAKPLYFGGALAAVAVLAVGLSSAAVPVPVGAIVNSNGKCLTNAGGKTSSNNPVQLSTCSSGASQQWTLASDGTLQVQGQCMEPSGQSKSSGTKVVIHGCSSGRTSQKWTVKADGTIVNNASALCLHNANASSANGNPIWIYRCNGTKAQVWTVPVVTVTPTPPAPAPAPVPTPTPPTPTTPTPTPGSTQMLGVGGVATPAGAVLTTADSTAGLKITSGGTATAPKVYDGQGHTVGTITIAADWVVVQNFNVQASGQYGFNSSGTGVTIQNNDIKGVHVSGDGDLNAITFFGNNTSIKYNTAIDFVSGNPGDSHTDFIQTWVSSSHPVASANVTIQGNKATGPANPSRLNSVPSIHQCVMAEGLGRGGNKGGNGDPSNWLIADNYFGDSWNQCIKLDGVDNATVTRNTFAGSSDHVAEVTTASSGFKYFSDNMVTGSYGNIGVTVTTGAGPTSL